MSETCESGRECNAHKQNEERLSKLNDELRKDLEIAEKLIKGEPIVKSINYEPGKPFDIKISHPMVAALAASCVDLIRQTDAKNYVETIFEHKETGERFHFIVQRADGKTPHELRVDAEFKATELEEQLAQMRAKKYPTADEYNAILKANEDLGKSNAELAKQFVDMEAVVGCQEKTIDRLKNERLDWRGVETACPKCGGSGAIWYGSTAMWRGGIGGAAMTRGACSTCWGSGDADRPWTNLRNLEGDIAKLRKEVERLTRGR